MLLNKTTFIEEQGIYYTDKMTFTSGQGAITVEYLIFTDDADRNSFVARLGRVISETQTPCFAWALVDNISTCY